MSTAQTQNKTTILIRCCDPRRLNEHNFNAMSQAIGVKPGNFYDLAAAGSIHFWKELIEYAEMLAKTQLDTLSQMNKCILFLSFHADCKGYNAYLYKQFKNINKLNFEEYKLVEKYSQLEDVKFVHNWIKNNYPNIELHILYSNIGNNNNIFKIFEITYINVLNDIEKLKPKYNSIFEKMI